VSHEFAFVAEDFGRVRQLIAAYAGISLHERKENMVYNRLARRLRATGLSSFSDYLDKVEAPGSVEKERFVNALTTNLTAFFREPHHFDSLQVLAKTRLRAPLRVWSSACSTGEEAYSAAMVLREAGAAGEILATDVDTDALGVGRRAVYAITALERLDPARVRQHFLKGTGANSSKALVRPELRAMIKFAPRNLLAPSWPPHEHFDIVFCRNVMIYFGRETQLRLLDRFAAILPAGGLLFLGHSESCAAGHPAFRPAGKTAFERRHG